MKQRILIVGIILVAVIILLAFFVRPKNSTPRNNDTQQTVGTKQTAADPIISDPELYNNQSWCVRGYVVITENQYFLGAKRSEDKLTLIEPRFFLNMTAKPLRTGYTCKTADNHSTCYSPNIVSVCGVVHYAKDGGLGPDKTLSFTIEDG